MKRLLVLALLLFSPLPALAQGTPVPYTKPQYFDSVGAVCSGCQLFTYASGTSTKLSTYSNATLVTPNTNPIVLDSAGRATIFLSQNTYKLVLAPATDTDPPASPIWTVDGVSASAAFNVSLDVTGTAGMTLNAYDAVYLSDGSGALTAGRWYQTDADNNYSSTTANAIGIVQANASAGDTISVRLMGRVTGLSGLSIGSLYYLSATAGAITTSAPTLARPFGEADTTTSLILSHFVQLPVATATQAGAVSISSQIFAGAKEFTGNVDIDGTGNVDGAFTNTSSTAALFTTPPTFKPGTSGASGTTSTVSGVVYTDATAHTTSASGTETTLSSFTVKANSLAVGKMLRVTFFGKFAATANGKRVRFYWGTSPGTAIFDWGAGVANNDEAWAVEALIYVTSSTANVARVKASIGGAHNSSNDASVTTTATSFDNVAGDITTDLFFKSTAEDATAAGGTVQQGFVVEVVG